MKCIIFGINGQDGYYLRKLFNKKYGAVIGVSRGAGDWLQGDVSNFDFVNDLVKTEAPDWIIHVAAVSTTRHDALFENHQSIAMGTLNVLEAVKRNRPECRVFITGSAVQFENCGRPIKEKDSFHASSPYAIARIQSVYAARYYRDIGIRAYVGYLFHHESAFRKEPHISRTIVEAVKRITQGSTEKLKIGDMSVRKEWGFAGDIAAGIFTLLEQETVFEAVIGTGKAYSIQDWIETCFGLTGLSWQNHIEPDMQFKQAEYKLMVSDPSTICNLGWKPKIDITALAESMLNNQVNP